MLKPELRSLIKPASVTFYDDNNPHPEFGKHVYVRTVNDGVGRSKEELYTGCTTISDAWDKSFFLGPWYAKEMAEELKRRIADIGFLFQENPSPALPFNHLVDEAKGAAKRKSEKAKVDGTAAHDWIEQYISAQIDHTLTIPETPDSQEANNATVAFHSWQMSRNIQWIASEEVVSSDAYKIAGKLDALAIVDGIPTIVDFKTSGQLSASYLLQCAGYDLMLSEMGFQVRQYIIVRIPKDGTPAETLTISDAKEIQFAKETFLHQREAHKFYVYADNKLKDGATHKMKVDTPATEIKATPTPTPKVVKKVVKKLVKKAA